MTETKHSLWTRLYRGETSFDFVGRRKVWFLISGTIIVLGLASLLFQGLNFSIDFKGGSVWEVNSTATVTEVRDAIGAVNPALRQATIEVLTNNQTGVHTVRISALANAAKNSAEVSAVSAKLATLAHVTVNQVSLNTVGPTWGGDITQKAERALVVFLIAVVIYISFRFEAKMAIAALVALLHDILITAGVYSLSGFQVSPATVIAFLTILGYSLYDTVVVFDKIEENTKGLAASQRITYTETVNLSMNQVLMRSINTSTVAIMPILSILVIGSYFLGASALQDFGLALFIGLLTGAYSSIFIASPILAVMKEREPRYSQIRQRLASRASVASVLTPAGAASGQLAAAAGAGTGGG
ncbi:MAG: protein translocase subunit SecF, partial [Acidimicrobiales bacterium]